jgi:hypothetical protein
MFNSDSKINLTPEKVKLFDIQSCQPDRFYFPCYDYDEYFLVNKN